MKNTKLIQVIQKLSNNEFREFGKFVNSPFFNEKMRLIKLYNVLSEYYPEFDGEDFTRRAIFEKLYPGEIYNDSKLRDGFSGLFKLAEGYLSHKEYRDNPFMIKNNLLKALDKNGLGKFFEKYLADAENEIGENKESTEDFFLRSKMLKEIKIGFNIKHDKQILICGEVIKREEYRIFHFVLQLIGGYRDMIVNQYSFNTGYRDSTAYEFLKCLDLEKFITYLEKSRSKYYPLIAMDYYLLKAKADNKNEAHFSNFIKLFNEFIDTFTKEEQLHFYTNFESYLIITHHSRSTYENEKLCFGIYKQILAKKLYSNEEEGFISYGLFNNIFFVALQLNEFKWLDEFVGNYIEKLRPEIKTGMVYICTAYIEFKKGNFEKALDNIVKVKYENYRFKLDVKFLMLKIYYELNSYEQLYSLIDTSKHFLSKNELMSEGPAKRYFNFTKFILSLVKMKTGTDFSGLDILRSEIMSTENVPKDWLLEKTDELKKFAIYSDS